MTDKEQLIELYRQMAELTRPECSNVCRVPRSCCHEEHCGMAEQVAEELWGVRLERIKGAAIPFIGPDGCIVPPHLRPNCTLHTCAINGLGFKPGDTAWTARYFNLRADIDTLEHRIFGDLV